MQGRLAELRLTLRDQMELVRGGRPMTRFLIRTMLRKAGADPDGPLERWDDPVTKDVVYRFPADPKEPENAG